MYIILDVIGNSTKFMDLENGTLNKETQINFQLVFWSSSTEVYLARKL